MAQPWEQDELVQPAAQGNPWDADSIERPAPSAMPMVDAVEPLPQAYLDRIAQGAALRETTKPESERTGLDRLLGRGGPRFQTWPERMIRSGLSLPKDVMDGTVITGPGLRKEDFSDDPNAPEPLDALIERSQDMAGFQIGQTSISRVLPHQAPLVEGAEGRIYRPFSDTGGTMRAQEVGTPPTPVDFKNSAAALGGKDTEANLQTMWRENGVHPAEAVHDAQQDAFLKHDLTTKPVDVVAEDPLLDPLLAEARNIGRPIDVARKWLEDPEATWNWLDDFAVRSKAAERSILEKYGVRRGYELDDHALTATEDRFIFGRVGDEITDAESIREMQSQLQSVGSLSEASREISYEMRRLPQNTEKLNFSDELVIARLQVLFSEVERLGGNLNDVIKQAGGEYAARFTDPEDAVFMAEGAAAAMHKLFAAPKSVDAIRIPTPDVLALEDFNGRPQSLGAAVNELPPSDIPFKDSPAPVPGRLSAAIGETSDKLFDIGRDLQLKLSPMVTGTRDSMAMAKDFANTLRRNRWEWSRVDDDIAKRFTPEQRTRMWNAADEESVARQLGESTEHQGLVTLEPAERAAVEDLQARAQTAWARARDLGMVEGEGLPAYTPRMVINAADAVSGEGAIPLNGIGLNLKTRTAQMMKRQHMTAEETEAAAKKALGESAEIARDIRTLPLATAKLEDAIAGRTLIENIKDYGKRTGAETVAEGAIPAGSETKWFTLDHPAFRTWRPKFEEGKPVKDAAGNMVFEQVPIYVHGDFEGPLRAVLTQRSGPVYGALMSLKGKTMSLIMNSPLIHNAVEWGRAIPAMPGKVATFKVYFEGNRARNDPAIMREAIDAGLVPIGKRFFNQDVTSIMEAPDLTPGRSWTAKVLGAVPGLFDEGAEIAVKRAVDKAGDFWHNTLLWDRIADLQAGLYTNFQADLMAKGVDRLTASRAAAHFANRYAGALPQEAMSDNARKIANLLMFSRSFTLGNVGVMKDMLNGLPRDVMAQIERDFGSLEPGGASAIRSMARRKAIAVVMIDMGMLYVGNSMLQSGINMMMNDTTLDQEMHGYAERFAEALQRTKEHPMSLLQPLGLFESLGATETNEPGKKDRLLIGYAKDGTAIYARNPVGKIGEEFNGYLTGPLDMFRRKQGTLARPAWQILSNDAGFGRKVYDPNADAPDKYLKNMGLIVAHLVKSQFPEGQINAFADLVKGEGDAKVNALQAFGPIAGVTFSKGAPGGPAVGELYHAREMHQYQVDSQLADIRKQIVRGDITGATERMNSLGISPGLQRFYIRTSANPATRLSPRAIRDFYIYSTPEQRSRMERLRSSGPLAPEQ